jgi:methylamine---glutamate N-methyltransferase subunit B
MQAVTDPLRFDLAQTTVRALNQALHAPADTLAGAHVEVLNTDGAHNLAVGLNAPVHVTLKGHAGYYAAGMNQHATVVVEGSASTGVAENMMSGRVQVKGFASNGAGASAHGGLLVIEGDAGLRCGISLKGGDIVVGGSVGSFSGFMAQAGRMVICGNAGDALGDSLYEAVIYVKGHIASLGADARLEPMTEADVTTVAALLSQAGLPPGADGPHEAGDFKRVASARGLYHWNVEANQDY